MTSGIRDFFTEKYSRASICPQTSPFTMIWLPTSLVGFRRIGFISTLGSMPAASACMTCARPISSPSFVMKELSAIFWDLNGATR